MKKYLVQLLTVFLLIAGACVVSGEEAASDDFIRSQWMKGYDCMEKADKAAAAGNAMAAVSLYNDALVVFIDVQHRYPKWHPALQNFRLKYCRKQIKELESKVGNQIVGMDVEEMRKTVSEQASELQRQLEEINGLKRELAVAEESLENARAEAAQSAAKMGDFEVQQEVVRNQESRLVLLEAQLEQARKELSDANIKLQDNSALNAKEAALGQAAAQLKEVTRQLSDLQRENENLREEVARNKAVVERQERQAAEYEKRLATASGDVAKFGGELHDVQVKLNEKERALAQANDKIAGLENQVAGLRRENDLLTDRKVSSNEREAELVEEIKSGNEALKASNEKMIEYKAQVATLNEDLRSTKLELETVRRGYIQLEQQIAMLQSDVKVNSGQAGDLRRKNQTLTDEMQSLRNELEQARSKSDELQKLAESRAGMIAAMESKLGEAERGVEENQQSKDQLLNQLQSIQSELNAANQEIARQKIEIGELQKLALAADALEGMTANLTSATEENDRLVAENQRLTAELANAKSSVELLEAAVASKVDAENARSAMQEEKLQDMQKVLTDAEANKRNYESKLANISEANKQLAQKLAAAEVEKSEWKNQHAMAVEENKKLASSVKIMENKVASTELAMRQLNDQVKINDQQWAKKMAAAEQSRDAMVKNGEKLQQENQALQAELAVAHERLTNATRDIAVKSGEFNEADDNVKRLQNANRIMNERLAEVAAKSSELNVQNQALKAEINENLVHINAINAQVAALNQEVAGCKLENENLRGELQAARAAADKLTAETQLSQQNQAAEQARQIADLERRKDGEKAEAANQYQREIASLQQKIANGEQQLAKARDEAEKLQQDVLSMRHEASESNNDYELKLLKLQQESAAQAESYEKRLAENKLKLDEANRQTMSVRQSMEASNSDYQRKLAVKQAECDTLSQQKKQLEKELSQRSKAVVATAPASPSAQTEELRAKLAAETKRRQDLELLLIQRDSNTAVQSESLANSQNHSVGHIPREQEILVNGFLRQAVEAEKAGKVETARWNYQKALEIDGENAFALKRCGLIAASAGDDAGAVKYLKQAFRQNPDDRDVLVALGYAMMQMGQPEWAVSTLARSAALAPTDADVQRQFAAALVEMQWMEAAMVQYKKAYELDPSNPETSFNIALLYLTMHSNAMKDSSQDKENRNVLRAQAKKYKEEAKKWYEIAKRSGLEPDPDLERVFK